MRKVSFTLFIILISLIASGSAFAGGKTNPLDCPYSENLELWAASFTCKTSLTVTRQSLKKGNYARQVMVYGEGMINGEADNDICGRLDYEYMKDSYNIDIALNDKPHPLYKIYCVDQYRVSPPSLLMSEEPIADAKACEAQIKIVADEIDALPDC